MNKAARLLVSPAVIALLALTGCQSQKVEKMADEMQIRKETTFADPMPPMEEPPIWTDGSSNVFQNISSKVNYETKYIARDGKLVTQKEHDGCIVVHDYAMPFSPAVKWKNCRDPDGVSTNYKLDDTEVWPLETGKHWSYRQAGTNVEGQSWAYIRDCAVEGQVRITTLLGTFDTFRVACSDQLKTRVWFLSPVLQAPVLHTVFEKKTHRKYTFETVSYRLN
ncbi:hypothetical protein J0X12_08140 [Sneathiella sp. CAU 1612]|uniref:Lipoprotein n=1 Tax=Sneathiella sedimenti TaxID=2816034 RepID=A0ABS3F5E9_9PROT|nr:hypothetical protein [Sneathiella sedimenti]MBO0333578.1 hypothetical protein [Sneathiella sedimenti]